MKDPLRHFRFDAGGFLNDEKVATMNASERGVYISVLLWNWIEGSVPDDPEALAPLLRLKVPEIKRAWPVVRERFTLREDGRLVNARLESERADSISRYNKARESGQRGGRASGATRTAANDGESDEGPLRDPKGSLEGALKGASTIQHHSTIYKETSSNAALGLDDVSLLQRLTEHGVSAKVARSLVAEFPGRTKNWLEWIPFQKDVRDKPAFLATAIREDFPRPKGRDPVGIGEDLSKCPEFEAAEAKYQANRRRRQSTDLSTLPEYNR